MCKNLDQLLLMDQGRLVAEGSHQQLKKYSPEYRMLLELMPVFH